MGDLKICRNEKEKEKSKPQMIDQWSLDVNNDTYKFLNVSQTTFYQSFSYYSDQI